jgi:hypothetical protein
MARLEDLDLANEPIGGDVDYDNLPPQDPNLDHMYEAFDDPACPNAPGMIGDVGKSLPVSPSRRVH